ncbi:MAG: hypothetical protein IJU57_05700 [Clostridia bacterium]|nr:hypothetical protein [Clostridia bacterium]
MTLDKLVRALELTVINLGSGVSLPEKEFNGVYAGDFLSRAMSHVHFDELWITIMNNRNVIAVASLTDCAAVILAENVELLPEAFEAAVENGITVLGSGKSVYELCVAVHELTLRDE